MGNAEQSCDQEGGEENEVALLRNSRTSSNVYVNQSEILSRPDNESIVNGQIIENGAGVEAKGVEHYSEEPQIEKNPRSDRPHTTQKLFVQKGCASRLQDTQERDLKDDRLSISCYQPAENLFQEHNKTYQLPREKRSTGSDLMNIEDLDTNELDIERILQVQTSHDLYCPTCNSCITRRVILCKRKRIIQLSDEEGKQRRLGTAANSKSGTSTAGATGIEGHPTDDIGVDDIHQGEPELFRCLSCFSFFIPIGNGFKLLGILGDKSAKENVPPEQIPRMKTNWFASLVTSNKKETSAEQGNSLVTDERKSNIGLIQSSDLNYLRGKSLLMQKCSSVDYVSEGIEGGNSTSESLDGRNKSDNATTKKKGQWFEAHTNNQLKDANFTIEGQPIHHSGKPVNMPSKSAKASIGDSAEDAASISQEGGSKLFSSDEEYWTLKQPENSQLPNQALQKIKAGNSMPDDVESHVGLIPSSDLDYQNGNSSLMQKGSSALLSAGNVSSYCSIGPLEGRDKILTSSRQEPAFGKEAIGVEDKLTRRNTDSTLGLLELDTNKQLKQSNFTADFQDNHESDISVTMSPNSAEVTGGNSAADLTSTSQQGPKFPLSSYEESMTPTKKDILQKSVKAEEKAITVLSTPVLATEELEGNGKINISVDFTPDYEELNGATVLTEPVVESKSANFDSSIDGGVQPGEVTQHIITDTKLEFHTGEPLKVDCISSVKDLSLKQGRTVGILDDYNQAAAQNGIGYDIINAESGTAETITSQREDISLAKTGRGVQSEIQIHVVKHEVTDHRETYEAEVIKSIVYGGLAESITSLSVVSSAAGGDAATLNVLALGMGNVIGGLFIIGHNLWQLKTDSVEQASNEVTEQFDHYKELLGRKQNFVLHATVSILSYLIFGLMPPLVCGISFRSNRDKELKLVVVAVASLLCIAVLAFGKAYVRRPPKSYFKTVMKFVVLGVVVSGVSYGAGGLIKRLLEKLRLFESSPAANLLLPEMTTKSKWATY